MISAATRLETPTVAHATRIGAESPAVSAARRFGACWVDRKSDPMRTLEAITGEHLAL